MQYLPTAKLWRLLAAMVYDSLVLMAITMAYGFTVILIKYQFQALPEGQRAEMGSLELVGLVLLIMGFYCFSWNRRGGQSLGMRAWRLKLVDNAGYTPNLQQCVIRVCAALISLMCLGAGHFFSLLRRDNLTAQDLASQTRIALLPKPEKNTAKKK